MKIGNINLVHLNKEYIRSGEVNVNELFTIASVTEEVKEREPRTRIRMQQVKEALHQPNENIISCDCLFKLRSGHCQTFSYSHKYVPAYSIHDIARIKEKKIRMLLDNQIIELSGIPDGFDLSDIQKNQVSAYKTKQPIVNIGMIGNQLDELKYPLYFLDYETYGPAIPMHKGFGVYDHIPFQFSLHKVGNRSNKNPEHFEFLHDFNTDPSLLIIDELKRLIGSEGSIIAWNKSFEQNVHTKLAKRHPEHERFLLDLNDLLFDL